MVKFIDLFRWCTLSFLIKFKYTTVLTSTIQIILSFLDN